MLYEVITSCLTILLYRKTVVCASYFSSVFGLEECATAELYMAVADRRERLQPPTLFCDVGRLYMQSNGCCFSAIRFFVIIEKGINDEN